MTKKPMAWRLVAVGLLLVLLLLSSPAAVLGFAAVAPSDRVVVVGASGGVGRYVVENLLKSGSYKVTAVVRDPARAREIPELQNPALDLVAGDVKDAETLRMPLAEAQGVVWCAGTTAFPSNRWAGGNYPKAVETRGIQNGLEVLGGVAEAVRVPFVGGD